MRQHFIFALAAPLLVACGDSGGAGGSGGAADDGKFHPAADGTRVDETPACDLLHDKLSEVALSLESCVTTFATCPGFVRSVSATDCAQYDGGTVDGCIAYYGDAADCDDLRARERFSPWSTTSQRHLSCVSVITISLWI